MIHLEKPTPEGHLIGDLVQAPAGELGQNNKNEKIGEEGDEAEQMPIVNREDFIT